MTTEENYLIYPGYTPEDDSAVGCAKWTRTTHFFLQLNHMPHRSKVSFYSLYRLSWSLVLLLQPPLGAKSWAREKIMAPCSSATAGKRITLGWSSVKNAMTKCYSIKANLLEMLLLQKHLTRAAAPRRWLLCCRWLSVTVGRWGFWGGWKQNGTRKVWWCGLKERKSITLLEAKAQKFSKIARNLVRNF